ncbi:MAG: hypothetical protein AABY22_12305, partial [Nanoarchaeota archaeon]
MKQTYSHNLIASFVEYLDHSICNKGSGFTNINVDFYKTSDSRLTGYAIYAAPYKQFVSNAAVSGAVVPSGISGVNGFISRNVSGLNISWNQGRAVFSGSINNLTSLSGRFSIKDFNIHYSAEPEESIIFDTKWKINNPIIPQTSISGLAENEKSYPAIYVKYYPHENTPFEFGGGESTDAMFRCIVVSDNQFKLDGANNVIQNLARSYFGYLYSHEIPYNFLGDIKSGTQYNYTGITTPKVGRDII